MEHLITAGIALILATTPLPAQTQEGISDKQNIEWLIKHVEELHDAVFVRNDKEYDGKAAARFLQGKWKANESEIATAKEFIEKLASVSSSTGKPYLIRFKDGREIKSGEYLLEEFNRRDALPRGVANGLRIVQNAAANYPKHRQCFSCHHQTLPMLAMAKARDRKLATDDDLFKAQAEFTHKSFNDRIEPMKEGKGIGGMSMTVGYGLWTLDLADWKPDDTTEAMVTFLLKNQKEDGHWTFQTSRPPLEDSNVTSTVLAAYGMRKFGTESQRESVEAAVDRTKKWLESATLESQEDCVMSLWGLHLLGLASEKIHAAREQILAAQHDDGGWAQLPSMESDAYATGQSLYVLRVTGLPATDPSFQRGAGFLTKTQCDDGSWRVETRSKPIQVFFDNGDPHGEHQFISIPATSWAVAALALSVEPGTK